MTAFAVSPMHGGDLLLGLQGLGIVVHLGQAAQPTLEPLGNRDLRHRAPKDKLPGRIEKPVRQGVNHVVPGAGFGLVERLWRLGRPLPGTSGTIERSAAERRGMARPYTILP